MPEKLCPTLPSPSASGAVSGDDAPRMQPPYRHNDSLEDGEVVEGQGRLCNVDSSQLLLPQAFKSNDHPRHALPSPPHSSNREDLSTSASPATTLGDTGKPEVATTANGTAGFESSSASQSPSSFFDRLPASCVPATPCLTNEDLDRAKSLVLDLLGWGVTPEYLVDCGLSPGTIYRIFTDLRLRLPSNLGLGLLSS